MRKVGEEIMGLSRFYTPIYANHNHVTDRRRELGECPGCDMLTKAEENEANQKATRTLELAKYNDNGIVRWDKSKLGNECRDRTAY